MFYPKEILIAEYEAQNRQLVLLMPVFLACGIGLYFSLPAEPAFWVGGAAFGVGAVLWFFARRFERLLPLFLMLAALGFCAAQVRTHLVHTPVLEKDIGPVEVAGTIVAIEDFGESAGGRVLLSDIEIEGVAPERTPVRVRLKSWKEEGLYPGQRIRVLAELTPPSPPVIPGGFDFQRYLYFQRIGAVGFVYKILETGEVTDGFSFWRAVERVRRTIEERIAAHVDFPQAATVMALTMGRQSAISDHDMEAFRASGLAHMLSISGLHVGLLSGAVFFLVRLVLVMVPGLALRVPIKKIAAGTAIAAAFVYMLLAGAPIPTQRAALMAAVFFTAVMIDRSPFSLRMLAFAAFAVLLVFPESLVSASFQMSFSAVACLIAAFDALRPYWSDWRARADVMRRGALYLGGICLSTVVATLATAPFSLFHFQQIALYSVLSNLLATPLTGVMIMPAILGTLVLMPLHLEFIPLWFADWGVRGVLWVAHMVAGLPHASLLVPAWPEAALVCVVLAGLVILLLHGRMRFLAALPLVISILFIFNYNQYDILISSSVKLVSVRGEDGKMYVSERRKDRFSRDVWARAYGIGEGDVLKWPKEGESGAGGFVRCDPAACRVMMKGRMVSYLYEERAQDAECAAADVVIAPFPLRDCGAGVVIDLMDGRRMGAYGLRFTEEGGIAVESSNALRGARPWASLNSAF